mmetsp:Transcript_8053/g.17432  ORF Transcript_8053/g.17432 Transcript_8053/m.17432 type:complete len:223 (+) Transcript_8053:1264-1932(+)
MSLASSSLQTAFFPSQHLSRLSDAQRGESSKSGAMLDAESSDIGSSGVAGAWSVSASSGHGGVSCRGVTMVKLGKGGVPTLSPSPVPFKLPLALESFGIAALSLLGREQFSRVSSFVMPTSSPPQGLANPRSRPETADVGAISLPSRAKSSSASSLAGRPFAESSRSSAKRCPSSPSLSPMLSPGDNSRAVPPMSDVTQSLSHVTFAIFSTTSPFPVFALQK